MNELSKETLAEVSRAKAYFPFRIVFAAISPSGEQSVHNSFTKARMNNLIRKGYKCFLVN